MSVAIEPVGTAHEGVPYYYKPMDIWVRFEGPKTYLVTRHYNETTEVHRISRRVASMLISNGMSHEG